MAPPLRLLRLANPFVRGVLRSPLHPLLSGALVLLEYRGRRTARRYRIPVMAVDTGGRLVALAARPSAKRWWRTFRDPAPARLLVRGDWLDVTGAVLAGADRRDALRAYLARFPRAGRPLGVSAGAPAADLDAVDAALVAFTPVTTPGGG